MKNLYITDSGRIIIDPENNSVDSVASDREGIRSVYLIEEPMHVYYNVGENTCEMDVEPGSILISFYERSFTKPVVVAKSADWVENIREYRKREQETKE